MVDLRKLGQPTKYRPEMCATVLEWGKTGATFRRIAKELGISCRTFLNWRAKHAEFGEAVEQAYSSSLARYEKLMDEHLIYTPGSPRIAVSLLLFIMRTRFRADYSEKVELKTAEVVVMSQEAIDSLNEYEARLKETKE